MRIERIADSGLSPVTRLAVARFRYHVFVRTLGWELPCEIDCEQDEFDIASATHIVAFDEHDAVDGYARLLPTTQPYLLATHYSHLLNGAKPPIDPHIWELSRFAAGNRPDFDAHSRVPMQTVVGRRLLLEAVRFVSARGCRHLVCCTTVAIERLARRWGVEMHRLGAPQRSSCGPLIAVSIQCSESTVAALTEVRAQTPALGLRLHAAGRVAVQPMQVAS